MLIEDVIIGLTFIGIVIIVGIIIEKFGGIDKWI